MCLRPDDLDPDAQDIVRGELTRSIRVGARPLTVADWRALLEAAGFTIDYERLADMALLQPKRVIADEGSGGQCGSCSTSSAIPRPESE